MGYLAKSLSPFHRRLQHQKRSILESDKVSEINMSCSAQESEEHIPGPRTPTLKITENARGMPSDSDEPGSTLHILLISFTSLKM